MKQTVLVLALLAAGLAGCGGGAEPSTEEKAFAKWLDAQVRWCKSHDPENLPSSDVDLCVAALDEAFARNSGDVSESHNDLVRAWQDGEGH